MRRKLPDTRHGKTHRAVIGDRKLYIITGEYKDGTLGEVFITIDKQGSNLRVYDCLAQTMTQGLQHGVPLEIYVDCFKFQELEPRGVTESKDIPIAKSIIDYLGKWLELKYLTNKLNESVDSSAHD